jgi:acetaldehyde dehydrogenase (acetylating)
MATKDLQSSTDFPDIGTAASTTFRKVLVVAGASQAAAGIFASPDALEPVVLTDTVTAITHDEHSNRDVSIDETATSEAQFAATATSAASAGDLVTISNVGTVPIQASGVLVATENT